MKCNSIHTLLGCFRSVAGRVASNLQSIFCFKVKCDDDDDCGGDDDADDDDGDSDDGYLSR